MTRPKKKILIFIDWYLPGFKAGGPIKSCVSLVSRLKTFYHFRIITSDTDLNETKPYAGITADRWTQLQDGTEVFYCSREFISKKNIEKLIVEEQADVIYLNSMFSLYFTLIPLWIAKNKKIKSKIVVAPRGMLSKGALSLKPLKKSAFLAVSKITHLFSHVLFHASTQIEVDEIKNVFGSDAPVIHAINLTPEVEIIRKSRVKKVNELRLAYVGRISEVKNLLQCLKVLAITSPSSIITFDIYGPHDDEKYYEACKAAIASLPSHIKVNLKGSFNNSGIDKLLIEYHFLMLLSMNENYGHAIVEAFSAGCPVIIGNRTPWHNLESKKCGWDLPLDDNKKIAEAVNTAASMNQETYDTWSTSAYAFADEIHNNKKTINDHHLLFETNS